jgi:hypothetical protein
VIVGDDELDAIEAALAQAEKKVLPGRSAFAISYCSKAPALRAAVMCHIRALESHCTIDLQVEVIWTLPRIVSPMVSE